MRLALEAGRARARRPARRRPVGRRRRQHRRNTLQSKVARLRRALGDPPVIASGDGGYTLAVEPSEVDALAVLRDAAAASALLDAGDDRGAADLCASALELYRGEVLPAAGDGDWVAPHRARLEEARMKLVETQFSARLRLGDVGDVIGELEAAVGDVPVPGGPVGAADHRAVPSRAPGRRAGDLPAGPEPAGRRARPRPRTAAAAARAADPRPRPGARRPRPPTAPTPAGNLPSMSAELVGRETEIAALSDLLAQPAARRDRRAGRHREDGGRDRDRSQRWSATSRRRRLAGQARDRDDGRRRRRHA